LRGGKNEVFDGVVLESFDLKFSSYLKMSETGSDATFVLYSNSCQLTQKVK